MFVAIFRLQSKILSVLCYVCLGYTKDDVKLLVDGMPLDNNSAPVTDYGIKPGSTVQMVIKVHGG